MIPQRAARTSSSRWPARTGSRGLRHLALPQRHPHGDGRRRCGRGSAPGEQQGQGEGEGAAHGASREVQGRESTPATRSPARNCWPPPLPRGPGRRRWSTRFAVGGRACRARASRQRRALTRPAGADAPAAPARRRDQQQEGGHDRPCASDADGPSATSSATHSSRSPGWHSQHPAHRLEGAEPHRLGPAVLEHGHVRRRQPDPLGELADAHLALGQLDVDAHDDRHQMTASRSVRSAVACRSSARMTTMSSPRTATPTSSRKSEQRPAGVVGVEADAAATSPTQHQPAGGDRRGRSRRPRRRRPG